MKNESTISKINQELISTFASLDAWFDKVLDRGFDDRDDHWRVLQHIVSSNYHLLDLLSDACDYALADVRSGEGRSEAEQTFHAMRFALREQLFRCLCVLDDLDQPEEGDEAKEMNVYEKLSSLTYHLQYHLEQFEERHAVER